MDKEELLQMLITVKKELENHYDCMDMTDFEMAIYTLEDDIEEDDSL